MAQIKKAGTLLIRLFRSFYRSIELTDGWRGSVAVNQALFLGMDAFLMVSDMTLLEAMSLTRLSMTDAS